MAIYLSEDIKHLLNDIEKFCNKYFMAGTFNRHMDKSKSKKADICLSTKFTDQTPNLCIVSLITERDTNNIYSNEAAKALCDLLIKWGRLKDNAEITKGSLIIPYDGVVHLNFEVFAVEPPEEHDQLVATIPASIKYGPPVSCKYCAFHSSASLEYPCCSCEDHSFFVFDTKKSEECPTKEHDQLVATIPASIKYGLTDRATTVLKTKLSNLKNEVNGLRSEWPKVDNLMCIENKLSEIITLIQNHQEPK